MIEIDVQWIRCEQCRLVYMAVERLNFECPVCGFPVTNLLPLECFPELWKGRPEG